MLPKRKVGGVRLPCYLSSEPLLFSLAFLRSALLSFTVAICHRLVPRRQQHLFGPKLDLNGHMRAVAQDRLASGITTIFSPHHWLYPAKLLRFRRSRQRRRRRQPAADHLLHLIEVSRAHKPLVLHRLVS